MILMSFHYNTKESESYPDLLNVCLKEECMLERSKEVMIKLKKLNFRGK